MNTASCLWPDSPIHMSRWSVHFYSNHILFDCLIHEKHEHLINEGAPDHKLTTILGTKRGIDALAKFVRESKAFQKQKARAIPP